MSDQLELKKFLRSFAATANNVVMMGSYKGDDVLVAAKFMRQCMDIVELLEDKKKDDGKQKTKQG